MKATPEEYDFHRRLIAGDDPTASTELAEQLYIGLVLHTQARAGNADPVLVEEAVGQALLDYIDRPERYNPELASLQAYLLNAAYRDYQNARAKEDRKTRKNESLFREETLVDTIPDDAAERDLGKLLAELRADEIWSTIEAAFPDRIEREIIMLIANDVRATETYAQVLGIANLPPDERAREVKRVKDRIIKRLRRLGGTIDE